MQPSDPEPRRAGSLQLRDFSTARTDSGCESIRPATRPRRDFAQRDFETIGPRQAAVNFSIDIVNGASFGHFADVFHVERLGPGAVKKKNGEHRARQQKKKRDLPAVAKENVSAHFLWASKASEKFHRL